MQARNTHISCFSSGNKYFPEDFRAFAHGPLAVCMDRFGGMDSIRLLEIVDFQGSFYPERNATDFFTRNGTFQDVPFGGPALCFGTETTDGTFRYCDTTYPAVGPDFLQTRGFQMILHQNSLSVKIKLKKKDTAQLIMDPIRYFAQTGERSSNLNQCAAWHESWLTTEERGPEFNPNLPFPNKKVLISREQPKFIPEGNYLLFQIDREYVTGSRPLCCVITASRPLTFSQPQARWILQTAPGAASVIFSMGFASTQKQALDNAQRALKKHTSELKHRLLEEQPAASAIRLSDRLLEGAGLFASLYPRYQNAAVVHETKDKLAFRAAQDKYGHFMMWDHIYPCRDFLMLGQPERTEKGLRFALEYPHVSSSMMIPLQLVPAVNELLAFLPDSDLVEKHLPFFRSFFDFTRRWCSPETGLVANYLCLAVDYPCHAGLNGLYYEAGMNAMWYNACRCMENFARQCGDEDFAQQAWNQAALIEKYFAETFFDPQEGFLRAAVLQDGSLPEHSLYLYTNTWGLDYIHGLRLYRPLAGKLADYQVRKLHHPLGHIFMPVSNGLAGSSSVAEHMNQHLGHECTCARLGGRTDEIRHLMGRYLDVFQHYRNAVETFNYSYCAGDQTQRADWQTFSATAAMQGLIHGLSGVYWHRGGLFYLPAEDSQVCSFANLHFRKSVVNFRCSGKGRFASSSKLNNRELSGTLQIPADTPEMLSGAPVNWTIRRSPLPPDRPVLLYALDAPVLKLRSAPDALSFRIGAKVHAPVAIQCTDACSVLRNGQPVAFEKDTDGGIFFDLLFNYNDLIEIKKQ